MCLRGENDEDEVLGPFQKISVDEDIERPPSPPMYLATGLGIGNGGCDMEFGVPSFEEGQEAEEFYERVLVQDPCNPLFLRNYPQLLQGDLYEAEKYYYCATVADPADGEILSRHVVAAYARFLWEIEDDGEDEGLQKDQMQPPSARLRLAAGLGIHVGGPGRNIDGCDSVVPDSSECGSLDEQQFHFLKVLLFDWQLKGDLHGVEYYSRAVLADPVDGEITSQYAKLAWELYGDQDKASTYFERAVQAAPADSHVLAAYASFLWEITDDGEEDGSSAGPMLIFLNALQNGLDVRLVEFQDLASEEEEREQPSVPLHLAAGLGIQVAGSGGDIDGGNAIVPGSSEGCNLDECYKKMIEENPSNSLIL
ncbi:hypothetical protein RJ641_021480 [Dillenia turbinata]|uniref:Uncharacterized protein n=1 Tax=Dillenia turbinata TaxID=194707 RepID=A0AAN8YSZ2_9MAGN